MKAGASKRSMYRKRRLHMLQFGRATALVAICVCELFAAASCARGRMIGPAPAEVHSGPVVVASKKTGTPSKPPVRKITQGVVSIIATTQAYDFTTPWAK